MKKKILLSVLALVVALIFTVALASCNSSEEPTQKPTQNPSEQSCAHAYDNSCDADCNLCGETREASHTPKVIEAIAPTCTETGLTEGSVCSVCNEIITAQKTVAAKGHVEVTDVSKPATCTETGLTQGSHCGICGETIVEQTVIEKTGHVEGGILLPVSATCTKTGLTKGDKCLQCGEILVEQEVIEMLPHDIIKDDAVPATCTTSGLTEGERCSVCEQVFVEQTVTPALGHKYSEKYYYDNTCHWLVCTHSGCNYKFGKEDHTMDHYNCTICDYYNGPKMYVLGSGSAQYRPRGYHFDSLEVAYDPIEGSIEQITKVSVPFGEGILINGWIGFYNFEIESFGYWFNEDIHNFKTNDSYTVEADEAVIGAGGQYAKRFAIKANTNGLDNITSVSFAALLKDGTYIVLKTFEVEVTGGIEMGPVIPDDEIIVAEPETLMGTENFTVSKLNTGTNVYRSQAGLVYTVGGQGFTYTNGKFNIQKSFVITFENDVFTTEFNKYKISYSSTSPLKAIVTYSDGGQLVTDTIFLEAGEQLFSCLTLGYVNGDYAKHITSIEIHVLGDAASTTFVLYDIETETVEVLNSTMTYLANERYELGIKLTWGGGISYIADKQDNNNGIRNLINCADAGRLVQQSYYGTKTQGDNGYQLGEFHEEVWGYNPVQGGNMHNEPSRIIDVQISGPSIYVKAQPRDWAQHNLTSSYMENVYTLYSDRIQVDNRFTEYSGFKQNVLTSQELPAFYTIGYLNTFVNYNGKKPWTGDSLSYDNDLIFWTKDEDATKQFKKENNETWCAWINETDDYGIGLYTPNVTELFAGRNEYDVNPDEMDATAQACSYVAAIGYFRLANYEPMEYSYLITTGSTQEIRDLFTDHKDFADNADLTDDKFR